MNTNPDTRYKMPDVESSEALDIPPKAEPDMKEVV
jgi:hypothetical protein